MQINKAAQAMGRKGGLARGGRKAEAARHNFELARAAKAKKNASIRQKSGPNKQ